MPIPAVAAPDVDATAVIAAMQDAAGGPDAVLDAFSQLYDAVFVRERSAGANPVTTADETSGSFTVALDLWRSEQPQATVYCAGYGAADMDALAEEYVLDQSAFGMAVRLPLASGAGRRVVCSFQYWDPGKQMQAFNAQVRDWCDTGIGPLTADPTAMAPERFTAVEQDLMATGTPWALLLWPVAGGDEGQTVISVIFDVQARAS